jgi:chaperone modulatory protein CbpM
MDLPGFTSVLRIEVQVVERWVEAGWLAPAREGAALRFSEADVARARLIRDMADEMGVNAEGIAVALSLLDQVHGLRRALRRVSSCVAALPEEVRREALAALERDG